MITWVFGSVTTKTLVKWPIDRKTLVKTVPNFRPITSKLGETKLKHDTRYCQGLNHTGNEYSIDTNHKPSTKACQLIQFEGNA